MRTLLALSFAAQLSACAAASSSGFGVRTGGDRGGPGATRRPAGEPAEAAAEFGSQDAARWLNGAAFTMASARGDVVLVESWHRL